MKKLSYIIWIAAFALMIAGCKGNRTSEANGEKDSLDTEEELTADSTVYGVCGEGTSMHSLELITDGGDTISYVIQEDDLGGRCVVGGLLAGDRLAVVGYINADKENVATKVINITTLLGKWTSIDKNFEIQEGGGVQSDVKAEANPWTNWKISNGQLLLNKDTFSIVELGADSLYLENQRGIYVYKRAKK